MKLPLRSSLGAQTCDGGSWELGGHGEQPWALSGARFSSGGWGEQAQAPRPCRTWPGAPCPSFLFLHVLKGEQEWWVGLHLNPELECENPGSQIVLIWE